MKKYPDCVYMDYNATTPIFPEVSRVMEPFTLMCFGNPSSSHVFSAPCKEAVKVARRHVQRLVNATRADEIIFTSCGTESDNRAIDLALVAYHETTTSKGNHNIKGGKVLLPHVVTCSIEHPAILVYLKHLEKQERIELTVLPVDEEGTIYPEEVHNALRKNTALVTIMHSNNEVGTIQPIAEIAKVVKQHNQSSKAQQPVLLHSDAAQSIGKVTVDVATLEVDLLTIVGHKFGAPKGIAALFVRNESCSQHLAAAPLLVGGGQEMGARGGTENVLLIAALGEAARVAHTDAICTLFHLLGLKKRLIEALQSGLAGLGADFVRFNGPERSSDPVEITSDVSLLEMILRPQNEAARHQNSRQEGGAPKKVVEDWMKENESCRYEDGEDDEEPRPKAFSAMSSTLVEQLPNTVSVSFKNVLTRHLMPLLIEKVACSAGSACHSEAASGDVLSPVLAAMRVPDNYGRGTLRLSFGRHTTPGEIDKAAAHITASVRVLLQSKGR
jgi:cysteine desulfurase